MGVSENIQILSPTGIREKGLCLWRQLNLQISFPVQLIVDEGTCACFVTRGNIQKWFASGRYSLNGIEDIGLHSTIESNSTWNGLRLFFITPITNITLRFRSSLFGANITIPCHIQENSTFWAYLIRCSYAELSLTEIEERLSSEVQNNFHTPYSTALTVTDEQITKEIMTNARFFEFGLVPDNITIQHIDKYLNADWSEEADMTAKPIQQNATLHTPAIIVYETEHTLSGMNEWAPEQTHILGAASIFSNEYLYVETQYAGVLGIHVKNWSEKSVHLSITSLNPYRNNDYGQQVPSKEIEISCGAEKVCYIPSTHDVSVSYSIKYYI